MAKVAGNFRMPTFSLSTKNDARQNAAAWGRWMKGALGRSLLLYAALFAWPASTFAQNEAIARQPYDVHIVVLLAEHRFLDTEMFQEQFPRDVVRLAKRALGPLARVDSASSHSLAEAIQRDGLDAALDGHEEVSQRRTWFISVQFHDGQFHLHGRFYDGLTGLPGPPALSATTSDRGRLAFLAARMVAEPFPLVGAVIGVKGDKVELMLHGGQIGDDAGVRAGDVFAISQIAVASGKLRARRLTWAVLEASAPSAGGAVSCRLWNRYQEEKIALTAGVVYRALLLPTRSAPLKLQVIDRETSQPLAGLGVKVNDGMRREFDLVTDAAGMIVTPEKITRLALVKLSQGGATFVQFPAPIVDERVLVCTVSTQADAENLARFDIRRQQLLVRILGTLQVVNQRSSELRILLSQSYEESRDYAKQTLAFLDGEIAAIRGERDEIAQIDAQRKPPSPNNDDADKGLKRLKDLRAEVGHSIERISQAIVDRDRLTSQQVMAAKLVEQAALLESQAQFDEAIEVYQKAAQLAPESGQVGGPLWARLRADWELKGERHKQARKFLVDIWPNVDISLLKEHFVSAQKALDVCHEVGDRLTPRRFLTANVDHLSNIARVVETLKQSRMVDDRQRLKQWEETVATLQRLSNEAIGRVEAAPAKR